MDLINCKKFLLYVVIALFTSLGFSCKQEEQTQLQKGPNIIYIMADALTIQAISAYGGIYKDIAPTPNIDRIAEGGMLFHRMLCTNAICGPSRAAILTGDYSNVNGYYKNESGGKFDSSKWTFPQAFQKASYESALFGKWHLGSRPMGFDTFKYHNSVVQQGAYWDPVYNENGRDVKQRGYATNLTTGFALEWLDKQKNSARPFLMLLQYKAPHRPWRPDQKYEHLWDSIEMPYPKTFNDLYKGREETAGDTEMTMDYLTRGDLKFKTPDTLKGEEKIAWEFYGAGKEEIVQPEKMTYQEGRRWRYQKFIKDYLACVRSIDDNIGKLLDYLESTKRSENTIIILTSDQGFYLGEHGFFDKRFIYEESLTMPFLVKYPGHIKPGSQNGNIISNIDIAPTLMELANIKEDHKMQGRSFAQLLKGENPKSWKNEHYYHYYEFPFWHHVQPHFGIRTQRYTLAHFYYNMDKWELYDLQNDPEQIKNLVGNPAYKDVLVDLKKQLSLLQQKYDPNNDLDDYRRITEKNFGVISDKKENVYSRNYME